MKRLFWKSLTKERPEYKSFSVSLLQRHISLTMHTAVTRNQVNNLIRHGVLRLIPDGIKPLPIDKKATGFFSFLYSRLFEKREFHPIPVSFKQCKTHKQCTIVAYQQANKSETAEHLSAKELHRRFFVSQHTEKKNRLYVLFGTVKRYVNMVEVFPTQKIGTEAKQAEQKSGGIVRTNYVGTEEVQKLASYAETSLAYLWEKSFKVGSTKYKQGDIVAKELRIDTTTETRTVTQYKSKEETGYTTKDMTVRRSLYKTHSFLWNSIPLRAYGTGMSALRSSVSPVFNPKDVEQTVLEKLFLACRGIDAGDKLGKLIKRIAKSYNAKKRNDRILDSLLEELSAFLIASGKNLYMGMLRKELRKVYTYDNRIDFLADGGGFFRPTNATGYDMLDA